MGIKHSTLAPTDEDLTVARICKSSLSLSRTTSTAIRTGRTFYIPRNVWNHINSNGISIHSLDGIQFTPVVAVVGVSDDDRNASLTTTKKNKNSNSTADRCLVEDSNGNLLAVLIAGHRKVSSFCENADLSTVMIRVIWVRVMENLSACDSPHN